MSLPKSEDEKPDYTALPRISQLGIHPPLTRRQRFRVDYPPQRTRRVKGHLLLKRNGFSSVYGPVSSTGTISL